MGKIITYQQGNYYNGKNIIITEKNILIEKYHNMVTGNPKDTMTGNIIRKYIIT